MKIQILGSGCSKCQTLFANAEAAVKQCNIQCEMEKITDIEKIVAMGVMLTPALAIDGKIVSSGKVLSAEEISKFLGNGNSSCACQSASHKSCGCCSCKKTGSYLKKIITVLLLIFVFGTVLYVIDKETKTPASTPVSSPEQETVSSNLLKVYYFHGTKRCMTCNTIEQLVREIVEKHEKVKFISVNVDESKNEHFVQDYQLVTRCVVMERNGKFEKFDRVWELARTPEDFKKYLNDGITRLSK